MRPIDQEICSLLKVRKIGGMELLFREYYKPLVVWATTFLHDTQRAEDIVQDFFVKLWEKPYSALLPETLKSYLFTSIRNLALNQLDKIDPLRRACDVACYIHLEEQGLLGKSFHTPFRKRPPWKFPLESFRTESEK